ncbi:MAG: hypothetical protein J6Q39_07815 [Bacteroidales bacterium]|nr:hypothetical protein [Bacteroidales bacterium]
MEYKEITIKLPIIKIKQNTDIFSYDWAKDNTPEGLYILDNGIVRWLCFRHLDYSPSCMELPTDIIDSAIAHKVQETTLGQVLTILNSMLEALKDNSNKTQFIIDEIDHIQKESSSAVDKVTSQLMTAFENAKAVGQSGAASPLEIAKALAIIQQPELIKEIR